MLLALTYCASSPADNAVVTVVLMAMVAVTGVELDCARTQPANSVASSDRVGADAKSQVKRFLLRKDSSPQKSKHPVPRIENFPYFNYLLTVGLIFAHRVCVVSQEILSEAASD